MDADWEDVHIGDGDHLVVTQGTFSEPFEIYVHNDDLIAFEITLTPSDDNDGVLEFDDSSYTLYDFWPWDFFRVGIPSGNPDGFYYISWTLEEVPYSTSDYMYGAPRKTTVEAFMLNTVTISIGSISAVPNGGAGFPIMVSTPGISPHSDISIAFAPTVDDADVTFYPSSIDFTNEDYMDFFAIGYSGALADATTVSFTITLSGTDMDSFSIASSKSFEIGAITTIAPSISDLTLTASSQTAASVSITLGSMSVVTWAFGADFVFEIFDDYSSYDFIDSMAYPMYGEASENQTTLDEQMMEYDMALSELDKSDWETYSVELLILAQFTYFYANSLQAAGTSTLYSFDNLIAETDYSIVAFADNYSGLDLDSAVASATTSAVATPAILTTTFDTTVSESNVDAINEAIALTLQVAPDQIQDFGGVSRRRLSTSVSSVFIADARSSAVPNTVATGISSTTLAANVNANGVTVNTADLVSREATSSDYPSPSFTEAAFTLYEDSTACHDEMIMFNFTSSVKGQVCCIAEYEPDTTYTLNSYDVYFEQDRMGATPAMAECFMVDAGTSYYTSWNFTYAEITDFGNYTFSCTACNNYPIVPECLADASVVSEVLEWTNATEVCGSIHFMVALSAILAYFL